jgi:hypothetical protein
VDRAALFEARERVFDVVAMEEFPGQSALVRLHKNAF